MPWRRLILASALIGVMLTVLVAWGCALWSEVFSTFQARSAAMMPTDLRARVPPSWLVPVIGTEPVTETYDRNEGPGLEIRVLSTQETTAAGLGPPTHELQDVRAGWPFKALAYTSACSVMPVFSESFETGAPAPGWLLPRDRTLFAIGPRLKGDRSYLPLRPIGLGFVGNALMYSAAAFFLIAATGLAVRSLRAGRLRCPSCGYHRLGLGDSTVCPECGMARSILP